MHTIAAPWKICGAGLLGFFAGVLLMEALATHKPAPQKTVLHPGEVLVSLLSKDLYWPKKDVILGQALWVVRLARASSLEGACRIHKQVARLRFQTELITIGFQVADYLLLAELIKNKSYRSLNKLAVVESKVAALLPSCTLRDAVIFHD